MIRIVATKLGVVSALAAALSIASCDRAKSTPVTTAPVDTAASAEAPPSASAIGSAAPEAPPIEAGPAAVDDGSTKEAREKAVLDLLSGGEPATRLPRDATSPGVAFDPGLRDRVAPSIKPARVQVRTPTVDGKLPAEVIYRIVRQNSGRFRLCYEQALRERPDLSGTVVIAFVIDRSGDVTNVASKPPAFPNPSVTSCVERGFWGLSFPKPEQGTVRAMVSVDLSIE